MIPQKMIVHCPTDLEAIAELKRRMAGIYAQGIAERIDALSCSTEQKVKLAEAVERRVCTREKQKKTTGA